MPDADTLAEIRDELRALRDEQARSRELLEAIRDGRVHIGDPLLSQGEAWRLLRRSKGWWYRMKNEGRVPKPDAVLDGHGGDRWRRSTVERAFASSRKKRKPMNES